MGKAAYLRAIGVGACIGHGEETGLAVLKLEVLVCIGESHGQDKEKRRWRAKSRKTGGTHRQTSLRKSTSRRCHCAV